MDFVISGLGTSDQECFHYLLKDESLFAQLPYKGVAVLLLFLTYAQLAAEHYSHWIDQACAPKMQLPFGFFSIF